jgi:hypothetical protein
MPRVSNRTVKDFTNDNAVNIAVNAPASAATIHNFTCVPAKPAPGDWNPSTMQYRQIAPAITQPPAVTMLGSSGSWNSSASSPPRRPRALSSSRAMSRSSGELSLSLSCNSSAFVASSGAASSALSSSASSFWCSVGLSMAEY